MMKSIIYLFLVVLAFTLCAKNPSASSNPGSLLPKECGMKNSTRIVGGTEVARNSYRWQAGLIEGSFMCGASIINEWWILCAAHCVSFGKEVTPPEKLQILVGAHNRSVAGDGVLHNVSKVIANKDYNEQSMQYDISLIKLKEPLNFTKDSKTVGPVCVADPSLKILKDKETVVASGWGTTKSGDQYPSDVLRHVKLEVVSKTRCQGVYGKDDITDKNICAGYDAGKYDSCQGDSGGPLIYQFKTNRWTQVGITSWGSGCAEKMAYGVYTRVSAHYDWILCVIKDQNPEKCPNKA